MASTTDPSARTDVDPTDIPKPGWKAVLRRAVKEFKNDNLTDWAAALTYYSVLALFPALIVLVAPPPSFSPLLLSPAPLSPLRPTPPEGGAALPHPRRDAGVQETTVKSL